MNKFSKCRCGSNNLDIQKDGLYPATIVECRKCNCMIGAKTETDAAVMWNAAMAVVTIEKKKT